VAQELAVLQTLSESELMDQRYAKFRRMGRFLEVGTQDVGVSS
jgi:acetyl-CoA carboxylase carboxyl transferase subunit alpha